MGFSSFFKRPELFKAALLLLEILLVQRCSASAVLSLVQGNQRLRAFAAPVHEGGGEVFKIQMFLTRHSSHPHPTHHHPSELASAAVPALDRGFAPGSSAKPPFFFFFLPGVRLALFPPSRRTVVSKLSTSCSV